MRIDVGADHSSSRGRDRAAESQDEAERAIVAGVRRGDRGAFESMYRTHYRMLVGFVTTFVDSEAVAEEEVQELFLAIWRQRERWEPRASLRSYLLKGARNRALNHLRHDGVTTAAFAGAVGEQRTLAMGEVAAALDEQAEADELATAARRAIGCLPPRCRMAFLLCRDHGLAYAEAAEVMGTSEHTVKAQMARAMAALRLGLARWLP